MKNKLADLPIKISNYCLYKQRIGAQFAWLLRTQNINKKSLIVAGMEGLPQNWGGPTFNNNLATAQPRKNPV